MMPIFWEGHQVFGQNRGRSGFQKRFGLVPGFWHLPHRCTKLGLRGVRTSLALRFALHKLFFVAGLNSGLSRPAVRLVNGVHNTSLVSPPGVSDEELVRKSWAWLSVQTQSSPTKFSTRGESLIIASSSNLLVIVRITDVCCGGRN